MAFSESETDLSRAHFVGVGGAGMSGLAKILVSRGARVSGSDAKDSRLLSALRQLGADIHVGHAAGHLPADASCVVVSSAIRPTNPELVAARERGVPVLHRADALAYLMRGRRAVTVAGTHGKTTTTSMLATSFQKLGFDPSYAIGADLNEPGSNAHQGSGDLFVAEADESDRSFHKYSSTAAIVLNIEMDHHDNYGSYAEMLDSFETFARNVVPGGVAVLSADDAGARTLAERIRARDDVRVLTYGESDDADLHILKIEPHGFASEVSVRNGQAEEIHFTVSVPGRHNANNATGALAVGYGLGVPLADMARAIPGFRGVRRRFQVKGQARGVTVVDSYAHHPTEMAADLATARQAVGTHGRVVVVYQPHLFSRTESLGEDMGRALAAADMAVVMDIYAAREDPVPGVTSHIVAHSALEHGAVVRLEHRWTAVPDVVAHLARPGDLVLTMGAGDVTLLGPEILHRIEAD